jgi:SAM-dependent methyltransferase
MNKVKEYWNAQAQKHQDNPLATTGDVLAAELEVKEILKYLQDGQTVLDIGCGNGYKDAEYCRQRDITLKGVDYSEDMIAVAKQYESPRLKFEHGDILKLNEANKYDVVITDRCLINLDNTEAQIKAIDNVYNMLKPSGIYLMLECTKSGLHNINKVREQFGLGAITERWHNNYLTCEVLQYAVLKFDLIEITNFNSTYFLISRTINALMGNQYDSEINKYAAQLPPLGDYSPLKLFVLRK